jgi:LPS O-antigen subunit length determinant protein (WzzB/FepE family)
MSDGIQPQYSDEVDLVELIQTVWNGKLVILAFVFVSLAAAFGFTIAGPAPDFLATSQIKPIFTEDEEKYRKFNAVDVYQVDADMLLAHFIEQLDNRQVVQKLLVKHRLLDRNDFDSDEDFKDALVQFASSINIAPPGDDDSQQLGGDAKNWTLSFEYNNRDKWLALLKDLKLETTRQVQRLLTNQFSNIIETMVTKRAFELEDLETAIDNTFADYEQVVTKRVAFLQEQAAIARTLNVADNTIETQSFSTQSGMITNITTEVPFYLRGYKAIEKELELLRSRDDLAPFIDNLAELQSQKRAIEQDKTVERAKSLFALSPIGSEQGFSAVSFEAASTTFKTQSNRMLMAILAAFIGGIIGIAYVLVSNAIKNRAMVTKLKP